MLGCQAVALPSTEQIVKANDLDFLLLIVPDSAHTQYTPITLGTLHIHMAVKLATKKELGNLNKQWKRSLVATKLTMKEAQIVGVNGEQITSKIHNVLKLARDTTISPFETIEVKGIIKTPNHYKHVNVVVDNLPKEQCCKDITVYHFKTCFVKFMFITPLPVIIVSNHHCTQFHSFQYLTAFCYHLRSFCSVF